MSIVAALSLWAAIPLPLAAQNTHKTTASQPSLETMDTRRLLSQIREVLAQDQGGVPGTPIAEQGDQVVELTGQVSAEGFVWTETFSDAVEVHLVEGELGVPKRHPLDPPSEKTEIVHLEGPDGMTGKAVISGYALVSGIAKSAGGHIAGTGNIVGSATILTKDGTTLGPFPIDQELRFAGSYFYAELLENPNPVQLQMSGYSVKEYRGFGAKASAPLKIKIGLRTAPKTPAGSTKPPRCPFGVWTQKYIDLPKRRCVYACGEREYYSPLVWNGVQQSCQADAFWILW